MILVIDTSADKNGVALFWPNKIAKEVFWEREKGPEQLLSQINKLLTRFGVSLKDLKAVAVFKGPGSFTGLRVGISVANTFAWVLKIPVIGFSGQNYQGKLLKMAQDSLLKIKKTKVGQFVKPIYHLSK